MSRPDWCPEDVWAAVAGIREEPFHWKGPEEVACIIARAILAERERAAKVAKSQAEGWRDGDDGEFYEFEASACLSVAAAIRAGATQ